jgi:hypothetical protein
VSFIINFGNAANTATLSTVDTLTSGSGADTIAFSGGVSNASIDLGGGSDTLTFGPGTNSATVYNAETIAGGSGPDTITLGTALATAMSVDLGAGTNKLTLAGVANTGTVTNVQTLVGGSGADAVTLSSTVTKGSIDLGTGSDSQWHEQRDGFERRDPARRHRRRHGRPRCCDQQWLDRPRRRQRQPHSRQLCQHGDRHQH